jgi:8-oxo-dGTP diphosphatase
MSRRKLVVAALVQGDDGRTLLTRRPPGKPMGGLWELPGGKVEEGEAPEAALEREIAEELGVGCTVGDIYQVVSHRYPDFDLLMLVYRCRLEGAPRAVEVAELAWVERRHLRDFAVLPADGPIIDRLAREG